jgi:hypothetical protein
MSLVPTKLPHKYHCDAVFREVVSASTSYVRGTFTPPHHQKIGALEPPHLSLRKAARSGPLPLVIQPDPLISPRTFPGIIQPHHPRAPDNMKDGLGNPLRHNWRQSFENILVLRYLRVIEHKVVLEALESSNLADGEEVPPVWFVFSISPLSNIDIRPDENERIHRGLTRMNQGLGTVAGHRDSICIHVDGRLPKGRRAPSLVVVYIFCRPISLIRIGVVLSRNRAHEAAFGSLGCTRILEREVSNEILYLDRWPRTGDRPIEMPWH